MKMVIAGGGTGGHLYPGIAIAREVLKDRNNDVLFVGTKQGIETRVLPRENLPVQFIPVGKLKGMSFIAAIKTLLVLPVSLLKSLELLQDEKPDIVLGVGGYASGPIGLAAAMLKIPLVIVEPNSHAGLANRKLAFFAKRVILCFPGIGAQKFFPIDKTVLLGPLTRTGIDQGNRQRALKDFGLLSGKFTVFIMGGSGGAHAINIAMIHAIDYLQSKHNIQILHQTGEKDFAVVEEGYRCTDIRASVYRYIDDMAGAYAVADLVVARSGATSVAELAICGKRAVLIPFPFAADNHQEHNAQMLVAHGSAEMILQKDLSSELLAKTINKYTNHVQSETKAPVMANTSAEQIVKICKDYVQKN